MTVLVVDDSALVRQALVAVLGAQPDIEVVVAGDPIIAAERMRRTRPDVIVLDLEMPRMDGLSFLEKLMREDPLPVVICSGNAPGGSEAAVRALEAGALEVVAKPSVGVRDFIEGSADRFIQAVRAAAAAHVGPPPSLVENGGSLPGESVGTDAKLVSIGASMGGPAALRIVLGAMRGGCPPILVAQHMPVGFTAALARNLSRETGIEVREAKDGDHPRSNLVLLAPGGRHLLLRRRAGDLRVELSSAPPENGCRPSVDALFRSVAQASGSAAVVVILTGMGSDGAAGLLEMKRAGATTLAQDEKSSAVYGMPRAAIAGGAVDEVVPISRIGWAICRAAQSRSRQAAPRA